MGIATITEWDIDAKKAVKNGITLTADFDPKSLQLTYTVTGPAPGKAKTVAGTWNKSASQQTSQSVSLSVDFLFDTSADGTSVQEKTDRLAALTVPNNLSGKGASRRVIRLSWGSFLFHGTVDSMTQTIDFFTADGIPLRASVHLGLTQVSPSKPDSTAGTSQGARAGKGSSYGANAGIGPGTNAAASAPAGTSAGVPATAPTGTTPFTFSQSGDSVQAIAARAGNGLSWQTVATANNIDNPRLIQPGTVLDTSAQVSTQ
jgi:nucleoid-associated protein YgaU